MQVQVYRNEVEKALKAFKRQFQKEGLLREIRARRFYEKPSEKKRRKQRETERRRARAARIRRSTERFS